jgi:hypothetical protein
MMEYMLNTKKSEIHKSGDQVKNRLRFDTGRYVVEFHSLLMAIIDFRTL